jgi:hypothetical protein
VWPLVAEDGDWCGDFEPLCHERWHNAFPIQPSTPPIETIEGEGE